MRSFEIYIDEDHLRRLVKAVIDKYEVSIRAHGSYQRAVEDVQKETVQCFENTSELCETMETLH